MGSMTVMTWTDYRVEQLKKLWEAGLSASQIAAELGNVTRNAVIGKVHRLGLSGPAKAPSSPAPPPRKARPPPHRPPPPPPPGAQGPPPAAHDAGVAARLARQHRAGACLRRRD